MGRRRGTLVKHSLELLEFSAKLQNLLLILLSADIKWHNIIFLFNRNTYLISLFISACPGPLDFCFNTLWTRT